MNRGLIGALSTSVAIALLAGCGGSQPPIDAPGVMPQSRAIAQHAARGKSWMLPDGASEDLLYVSDDETNHVYVFAYPGGKRVGGLTGFNSPRGECVDSSGDVWIVNQTPAEVIEYAHGGSTPIATLSVPGGSPEGCAIDPATGSLAVTNQGDHVSIYAGAQGTPTTYIDSDIGGFGFCSYDNSGNLFIGAGSTRDGVLAELPKGSGSFASVTFKPKPKHLHISGVQWDGEYMAVGGVSQPHSHKPAILYRVQIAGDVATIEGVTKLSSRKNSPVVAQFWIQGSTVAQSSDHGLDIGLWRYPVGGNPEKLIRNSGGRSLSGTAVSLAQ
jgi:hypothetical protein